MATTFTKVKIGAGIFFGILGVGAAVAVTAATAGLAIPFLAGLSTLVLAGIGVGGLAIGAPSLLESQRLLLKQNKIVLHRRYKEATKNTSESEGKDEKVKTPDPIDVTVPRNPDKLASWFNPVADIRYFAYAAKHAARGFYGETFFASKPSEEENTYTKMIDKTQESGQITVKVDA